MHENANLAFSRNETATVVGTILDLQPLASGGSGGQSTDDVVKDMAEAILAKIDILLDIEEGKQSLFDLDRKGKLHKSVWVLTVPSTVTPMMNSLNVCLRSGIFNDYSVETGS